jgi:transposase-like protein
MNRVTNDDALFGYRLQLFDLPARTSVSEACRTMGMHRSTYYYRQRQVDRHGLEILRPRERRRPAMPNQLPRMVEERILAFARAAAVGRPARLGERCLALSPPPRALHPHQATGAGRRLPRPLRAAARAGQ